MSEVAIRRCKIQWQDSSKRTRGGYRMTVEELIDSVDKLRKEVSTLTVDFREVRSPEAKAHLEETLATKELELSKLLASNVKYIVEPVETAPVSFLEYIQTEPWPKNYDCSHCVIKANNDPAFRASACSYCALTKPKDDLTTRTIKKVVSYSVFGGTC